MDDYSNYVGLLPALRDTKEENEEKVAGMNEAMKEKIKQFTDPIGENFMGDAFQGLTRKTGTGIVNFLTSKGFKAEDVEKYKNAYKKGGVKEVIKQGLQDGKDKVAEKLGTVVEGPATEKVAEKKISDLAPEEYDRLKSHIQGALQERYNGFKDAEKRTIQRKFQNEKLTPNDEPNSILRNQANSQKVDDLMNEMEQRKQALDPSNIQSRVIQMTGDDDDSLLNNAQRTIQGGFKAVSKEGADQLEKVGGKVGSDVEKVGEKVAKAGVKAGETAGEIEAEGGGPEDLIGDVAAGVAGIATFLGGIHASKHLHEQTADDLISNVSYQAGT